MKEEPRRIDVEVLPKDHRPRSGAGFEDPLIDFIARLMDSIFTIPGTRIRFGLDPLIGLLPAFGSPISALISLFLIARSAQYRVPRVILARMALNVVINAALDAVPVVGDTLSIFFRSNARNYDLLREHAGARVPSTKRDWIFVAALIGGVALFLTLAFVGLILVLTKIVGLFRTGNA